ncbi:MAG: YkvA family protein [Candidatus Saccharicenans sp.]
MTHFEKLKARAERLKNEVLALSLALKDRRTPLIAKILIGLTVSYALSPIDLIPDFIPVLGYVDDLIILPALVALSIKLIPREVLDDCRARMKEGQVMSKMLGWLAAGVIILFWAVVIVIHCAEAFSLN